MFCMLSRIIHAAFQIARHANHVDLADALFQRQEVLAIEGRWAGARGLKLGVAAAALGDRALLVVAYVQLQQGLKPLRCLGGLVEITQCERLTIERFPVAWVVANHRLGDLHHRLRLVIGQQTVDRTEDPVCVALAGGHLRPHCLGFL